MNILLFAGLLVVTAFIISFVVFALSRKKVESVNAAVEDKPAPVDRWSAVAGKGHNGDDIENIRGVTVDEAKLQCTNKSGCKGLFFYNRDKESGKGDAWLKSHAREPYSDYPADTTYLYNN